MFKEKSHYLTAAGALIATMVACGAFFESRKSPSVVNLSDPIPGNNNHVILQSVTQDGTTIYRAVIPKNSTAGDVANEWAEWANVNASLEARNKIVDYLLKTGRFAPDSTGREVIQGSDPYSLMNMPPKELNDDVLSLIPARATPKAIISPTPSSSIEDTKDALTKQIQDEKDAEERYKLIIEGTAGLLGTAALVKGASVAFNRWLIKRLSKNYLLPTQPRDSSSPETTHVTPTPTIQKLTPDNKPPEMGVTKTRITLLKSTDIRDKLSSLPSILHLLQREMNLSPLDLEIYARKLRHDLIHSKAPGAFEVSRNNATGEVTGVAWTENPRPEQIHEANPLPHHKSRL